MRAIGVFSHQLPPGVPHEKVIRHVTGPGRIHNKVDVHVVCVVFSVCRFITHGFVRVAVDAMTSHFANTSAARWVSLHSARNVIARKR